MQETAVKKNLLQLRRSISLRAQRKRCYLYIQGPWYVLALGLSMECDESLGLVIVPATIAPWHKHKFQFKRRYCII